MGMCVCMCMYVYVGEFTEWVMRVREPKQVLVVVVVVDIPPHFSLLGINRSTFLKKKKSVERERDILSNQPTSR